MLIGCYCDEEFVEQIDHARGSVTRSQFCRDAMFEKLKALGVELEPSVAAAPDRTGKGGPKPKNKTVPIEKTDVQLDGRGFPISSKIRAAAATMTADVQAIVDAAAASSPSHGAVERSGGKDSPKRGTRQH